MILPLKQVVCLFLKLDCAVEGRMYRKFKGLVLRIGSFNVVHFTPCHFVSAIIYT